MEDKAENHVFCVITNDRVHYFSAEDSDEMFRWIDLLSPKVNLATEFAWSFVTLFWVVIEYSTQRYTGHKILFTSAATMTVWDRFIYTIVKTTVSSFITCTL